MRGTSVLRALVCVILLCAAGLVAGPAGSGVATPQRSAVTAASSAPAVTAASTIATVPTARKVAVGFEHTCALTSVAGVQCWGHNQFGQVGSGSTAEMLTRPTAVSGLGSGVASVAAGEDHTCAVLTGGTVRCWGSNTWGMLGNGTLTDARTPVAVSGLSGIRQVAPGGAHSCAVTTAGKVSCWGLNDAGELGDGTTTQSLRPRAVVGLPRPAVDVATGVHHSCAVLDDRSLWCWGWNFYGQLGALEGRDTGVPTRVSLPAVADVSARLDSTCATTTTGVAYCWGFTGFFTGDTRNDEVPVRVEGISSGSTLTVPGWGQVCGIVTGAARCWGSTYDNLGLGDGTTLAAWRPVTARGLGSGVTALDANYFTQCVVDAAAQVRCWGGNAFGQLGTGTTTESQVPTTATLAAVSTTASSTTASSTTATSSTRTSSTPVVAAPSASRLPGVTGPRTWDSRSDAAATGRARAGHPADGSVAGGPRTAAGSASISAPAGATATTTTRTTTTTTTATTATSSAPALAQIAVAAGHTCARTTAGGVYCWGSDLSGQVGVSTDTMWGPYSSPVAVPTLSSGVTWIATNNQNSCAVKSGQVWCWGDNSNHQVSPSDEGRITRPTRYLGIAEPVRQVEVGYTSTCALTVAGAVKCWGTDYLGGLGDGVTESSATPIQVKGLTSGVTSLSTNEGTCAVKSTGEMWCWGFGANGELGNGTESISPVPVKVLGLGGAATRATRGSVSCALVGTGTAKCWGYGRAGQLGNGRQTNAVTASLVTGLGDGVKSISSGNSVCAVLADGRLSCWGGNAYGIGSSTVYGTLAPRVISAVPAGTAKAVDMSSAGGCVILVAGGASCWGWNGDGGLGAASSVSFSRTPLTVAFP